MSLIVMKVFEFCVCHVSECKQDMDIVIVLDGSNSIYPWNHITEFLVKFLQNIELGPARVSFLDIIIILISCKKNISTDVDMLVDQGFNIIFKHY